MRYNKHINKTGAYMFTNCVAKAKLTFNKKLKCYKVLIAFTHNNKFTQRDCAYVSGDISADTLQADLQVVLANAEKTLRTSNIVFVE
jgi:hypothetical protein